MKLSKILTPLLIASTVLTTSKIGLPKTPINKSDYKRANYLEEIINNPSRNLEIFSLNKYNPEWSLFTLSFSSYAFANIAESDTLYTQRATQNIDNAIQKALSPSVYNFSGFEGFPINECTGDHAIYLGHLNLMLGSYKKTSNDPKYDGLHTEITEHLSTSIKESPFHNIESYPGFIWPADNSVAVASIELYDQLHETNYSVSEEWTSWINNNFLDEKTGLMNSQMNPSTGESLDGPRGCSLAWTTIFSDIYDEDFAKNQYDKLKSHFSTSLFGLTAFRERPFGESQGRGDIDSGPIFLGYGTAATGIATGAANAVEDNATYQSLKLTSNLFSTEVKTDSTQHYNYNTPLSDAMMLYFRTIQN
jgi:hypothetical protein